MAEFIQKTLAFDATAQTRRLIRPDFVFEEPSPDLIRKLCEDRKIERKTPKIHLNELGEYLSMWANTPPDGGLIVIGLSDDGEWVGLDKLSDQQINDLELAGEKFCPDARVKTKRIRVRTNSGIDDWALLFHVPYRDDKLVRHVRGKAYYRVADTKRTMPEELAHDMERDKGHVTTEKEPCGLNYPDDFNAGLVSQFVAVARAFWKYPADRTAEEVLALRHLGKFADGKFVPNLACALLMANDPVDIVPGCKIRFLRYDGEQEGTGEKWNAVKDIWIEGRVPDLITGIESVLDSQLRTFSRLGTDGKFYTATEYPKPAWYEAVVNACVHRSYGMRSMCVFVKMFDNKLVIESPGALPATVTPENIYQAHNPRNRALMEALYHLEFVKCAHEGCRRIRDTMKDSLLPAPEFAERDEVGYAEVRVTLRNNIAQRKVWIDSDASAIIGEALSRTLEERELRTINFAAEYGSINASQAMRLLGCNWHTAKAILARLAERQIFMHQKKPGHDTKARFLLNTKKPKNGKRTESHRQPPATQS